MAARTAASIAASISARISSSASIRCPSSFGASTLGWSMAGEDDRSVRHLGGREAVDNVTAFGG